jgi:hypothetical protein
MTIRFTALELQTLADNLLFNEPADCVRASCFGLPWTCAAPNGFEPGHSGLLTAGSASAADAAVADAAAAATMLPLAGPSCAHDSTIMDCSGMLGVFDIDSIDLLGMLTPALEPTSAGPWMQPSGPIRVEPLRQPPLQATSLQGVPEPPPSSKRTSLTLPEKPLPASIVQILSSGAQHAAMAAATPTFAAGGPAPTAALCLQHQQHYLPGQPQLPQALVPCISRAVGHGGAGLPIGAGAQPSLALASPVAAATASRRRSAAAAAAKRSIADHREPKRARRRSSGSTELQPGQPAAWAIHARDGDHRLAAFGHAPPACGAPPARPLVVAIALVRNFIADASPSSSKYVWFKSWRIPDVQVLLRDDAPAGCEVQLLAFTRQSLPAGESAGGAGACAVTAHPLRGVARQAVRADHTVEFHSVSFECTSFKSAGQLFHLAIEVCPPPPAAGAPAAVDSPEAPPPRECWLCEGVRVLSKSKAEH